MFDDCTFGKFSGGGNFQTEKHSTNFLLYTLENETIIKQWLLLICGSRTLKFAFYCQAAVFKNMCFRSAKTELETIKDAESRTGAFNWQLHGSVRNSNWGFLPNRTTTETIWSGPDHAQLWVDHLPIKSYYLNIIQRIFWDFSTLAIYFSKAILRLVRACWSRRILAD